MPKNKDAIIRYHTIDNCLTNKFKKYPSLEYLKEKCEEALDTKLSISTIQKDIKEMRYTQGLGYNAPIKYDKINDGYFYTDESYSIKAIPIDEEDINAILFAATTLYQYKDIEIFEKFNFAIEKILQTIKMNDFLDSEEMESYIQFEKAVSLKGSQFIGKLANGIKEQLVVQFDYQPFDADKPLERIVHPYLLKEYRNRWYLIGMSDYNRMILTYAIDRMSNVELLNQQLSYHPTFDPKEYYQYAFGIVSPNEAQPKEIVLSFSPGQGNYAKTQPLHESQKIMVDNDEELRISLNVYVTIELIMQILSYGREVKVIKPVSLKNEIKKTLADALKKYN